ncbi:hypothetical protein BY996DRAFT_6950665 [Phakopsora pachyrhizi]|nr:hypothetical protein BY996DRAFT_6950665 [Phakopsora pachyrhizi]
MLKEISLFYSVYLILIQSALAKNWITCSESLVHNSIFNTWSCQGLIPGGKSEIKTAKFGSIVDVCVDVNDGTKGVMRSSLSVEILPYTFYDCTYETGKTVSMIDNAATGYVVMKDNISRKSCLIFFPFEYEKKTHFEVLLVLTTIRELIYGNY